MRSISSCIVFFITLLFIACHSDPAKEATLQKHELIIQPFSDLKREDAVFVQKQFSTIYPNVELRESLALPQSAWFAARQRYRADSLLIFLNQRSPDGSVTVGLTTKDISTTKGNISDWGVMGLGYCPGRSCVASTFRLSKQNTREQLFKIVIHELGHTQGLEHCPVKTCFMRDAEGKNPTDEETAFCSKCKAKLIASGWNLR